MMTMMMMNYSRILRSIKRAHMCSNVRLELRTHRKINSKKIKNESLDLWETAALDVFAKYKCAEARSQVFFTFTSTFFTVFWTWMRWAANHRELATSVRALVQTVNLIWARGLTHHQLQMTHLRRLSRGATWARLQQWKLLRKLFF